MPLDKLRIDSDEGIEKGLRCGYVRGRGGRKSPATVFFLREAINLFTIHEERVHDLRLCVWIRIMGVAGLHGMRRHRGKK